MSGSKEPSSTTVVNQSSTTQPSAEEVARNRMLLGREEFLDPQIRDVQSQGLSLVNQLLLGRALPGYLGGLPGGISPEVTNDIVQQSLSDIQPRMQQYGLLDSGVNAEISARTAADVRTQSAQFNLNNLLQLLNIGVGGQAQVQQPIIGFGNQLTQGLAGLRNVSSNSTQNTYAQQQNPFLAAFSNPKFSIGPFGFGG